MVPHTGGAQRLAVVSLVLALFAACRDTDPPPTGLALVSSRAAVVASPDDTNWNVFEADVDVSVTGSTSPVPHAAWSRGLGFRVTKRRVPGGDWVTSRDFGNVIPGPANKGAGFAGPPRLARVVESRGQIEFFDARGRRVTPPRPTAPAPTGRGAAQPRPTSGTMPTITPPQITALDSDTSRDWVDRYLVSAAGAARGRARLNQSGSAPTRLGNGYTRYTQNRGNARMEIDVDERTGLVDAIRIAADGRVISETHRTYTRRDDGVYVLGTEHIRQFTTRAGAAPQEMMVRYRNIRLLEDR